MVLTVSQVISILLLLSIDLQDCPTISIFEVSGGEHVYLGFLEQVSNVFGKLSVDLITEVVKSLN